MIHLRLRLMRIRLASHASQQYMKTSMESIYLSGLIASYMSSIPESGPSLLITDAQLSIIQSITDMLKWHKHHK